MRINNTFKSVSLLFLRIIFTTLQTAIFDSFTCKKQKNRSENLISIFSDLS